MSVRYVNPIVNAVRKFDGYKHSKQNYMAYGWQGLENSGYAATRLTAKQESINLNLKQKIEKDYEDFCM